MRMKASGSDMKVTTAAFPLTFACWGQRVGCLLQRSSSDSAAVAAAATDLYEKYIVARYTEPQRHYHTMTHLEEMLGCLARFQSEAPVAHRLPAEGARRLVVELAIFFHDAVYDPRRSDNEERSAAWFQSFWDEARRLATSHTTALEDGETRGRVGPLLWDDLDAARGVEEEVVNFILQTKQHMAVEPCYTHRASQPGGTDDAPQPTPPPPPLHIFLDLDLAILGTAAERYRRYALDIRREYSWHSEADFCRGRAAFLRVFLNHPQWYKTKFFFDALESSARANVEAEVAALEARLEHLASEERP
ncbi:hd phosphohydrolase family protein [Trypanosoma cruzi]|uniref:Hd phosphohydrolase family protein n=2 Tax=Trypanosoma cruzi TaxID=5693 RepID=Q4D8L8_TRYCC|nr:hypothetical protein, conserved [Trypanosoma cruzi]EAN88867.1 hypothetical protein, conserved [Trypanosoma cruzi]KAF5216960.1 hd phosphohydrolase family protein [Trypanosoma cruzi]KAF8275925.1 hd phosphohydrolase family protein [Trypanosoma cruzi]PWV19281.1 hd phosphohydrolase family protein [Trypanosoma cruzi]RNC55178.1 hypothetical protein TcCL_ESM07360 [Trypanosoma cruzi]|eukprot:XP_810718.1 hypothetical protein [Trypanosoma cruzi strain CL Brener]